MQFSIEDSENHFTEWHRIISQIGTVCLLQFVFIFRVDFFSSEKRQKIHFLHFQDNYSNEKVAYSINRKNNGKILQNTVFSLMACVQKIDG